MLPSLAERITERFYAWELRGRGWQTESYPVALEPPYRPCQLLPQYEPPAKLDDGRRPTLLSSLIDRTRDFFFGEETASSVESEVFEEVAPHPAPERDPLVSLRLQVASDFASNSEVAARLLQALSASTQPISLEFCGCAGAVSMQIVCAASDVAHAEASIQGYVPEASALREQDLLVEHWLPARDSVVVDFGLSDEFFLPLATFPAFRIDPYIPLVSALARTGESEFVCLQVLFERARNPWGEATIHALTDREGRSIFADAPEFLPLAKEKTRSPLHAVVLRVGAQASSQDRAFELARSIGAFILQFERAGSNELIPLENVDYPVDAHAACLLARESRRTGMLLSADELVGFVHLPDASVRHLALVRDVARTKAPPLEAVGHAVVLGENVHRGARTMVTLSDEARLQHMHVIGASGTGKSTLLLQLLEQDIRMGRGVALLDPHGDLVDAVLARVPEERIKDVVLFDPFDEVWPVGLNVLSASGEHEKTLLASDLTSVFERLSTSWGDTMGAVLSNAILTVLEHPSGGTLVDLRRLLVDETFRREFLRSVEDEEVQFFWSKSFPAIGTRSIGPILTRLDAFLRPRLIRHIVGQRAPKLDLGSVLAERKVFLAKLTLGLIGKENASLLGSLLATRFHQLALGRQRLSTDARHPFLLYADEAQHFVTPSMAALLTDVRKYGFGLVLSHQNLFQLRGSPVESALLGNAYARIAFRVGTDDAKRLAEGLAFFESKDFVSLSRGEAIARVGSAGHDCNLRTLPLVEVESALAEARRDAVVQMSRQRFAASVDVVRAELAGAYQSARPVEAASALAPIVSDAPDVDTSMPTSPNFSAPTSTPAVRQKRELPDIVPPPLAGMGRGGPQHKYLQHLVKRLAEERGFRAVIEEPAGSGQVDVGLRREDLSVAVEISISTEVSHEIDNLEKCWAAGFTHLALLCPDARRRQKFSRAVGALAIGAKTQVLGPDEFVAYLDQLAPASTESNVRGYKVRIKRQQFSPSELATRRALVANVIAQSIGKPRKDG